MTCPHTETDVVPTPELIHHGKTVCRACGKFLGWVKKPETLVREKQNAERLKALDGKPLTQWERGFVLSLTKQGSHFSPNQQKILDEMAGKYGC